MSGIALASQSSGCSVLWFCLWSEVVVEWIIWGTEVVSMCRVWTEVGVKGFPFHYNVFLSSQCVSAKFRIWTSNIIKLWHFFFFFWSCSCLDFVFFFLPESDNEQNTGHSYRSSSCPESPPEVHCYSDGVRFATHLGNCSVLPWRVWCQSEAWRSFVRRSALFTCKSQAKMISWQWFSFYRQITHSRGSHITGQIA